MIFMAEKVVIDEDYTEKKSDWDESDVGKKIAKRITPSVEARSCL